MSDFLVNFPMIALCGFPKSGKSEVQRILTEEFGIVPMDDGRAIRDTAKRWFGLTEWQVTTQEGKASFVEICGHQWQVRKILGDIGQLFEDLFGEHVIAETAIADAVRFYREALDQGARVNAGGCSFGSVRKRQGWAYRGYGGRVVEVRREGAHPIYEFDRYDQQACEYAIDNNGTLDDLRRAVLGFGEMVGLQRVSKDAA